MEVGTVNMKEQRLNHFKNKLQQMRIKEVETDNRLKDGLRNSMQDSVDELSFYDNHPADVGDVTFERGKDLGFKIFTENKLAKIDEALKSIEEGTYGYCSICGKDISLERLEAVPYASLCKSCKKKEEDEDYSTRPVEESVIAPPYGQNLTNKEIVNTSDFDGEDSWQSVAKFGTSNSPSDLGGVEDYVDTYVNADESIGVVQNVESIITQKSEDGQIYQSFIGEDDEEAPSSNDENK